MLHHEQSLETSKYRRGRRKIQITKTAPTLARQDLLLSWQRQLFWIRETMPKNYFAEKGNDEIICPPHMLVTHSAQCQSLFSLCVFCADLPLVGPSLNLGGFTIRDGSRLGQWRDYNDNVLPGGCLFLQRSPNLQHAIHLMVPSDRGQGIALSEE